MVAVSEHPSQREQHEHDKTQKCNHFLPSLTTKKPPRIDGGGMRHTDNISATKCMFFWGVSKTELGLLKLFTWQNFTSSSAYLLFVHSFERLDGNYRI